MTARDDLIRLSQNRVEAIARKQLRLKFLDLKTKDGVLTHDVQNEAYAKLRKWVEEGLREPFPAVAAYFAAVHAIVRHILADFARTYRKRPVATALAGDIPAPTTGEAPPPQATLDRMWELVAELPPDQREAIELKFWLDLTLADIRDVMGLTDESAAWRLIDAGKKRLRQFADRVEFDG